MQIRMLSRHKTLALSAFAGVLYPLGFAPFSWWPLSVLSVALVFHLWSRADRATALWSAGIYGLCVYGVGVSWVYVSMVNFGNMLPVMAVFAVILFALVLTLYFIAPIFLYTLLAPGVCTRHRVTILLPILWVVFEWLRGILFTGFAWLYLGYTGVDTWVSGWATIAGVSAVSFVFACVAGQLVYVYQAGKAAYVRSIVAVLILVAISWGLQSLRWVEQSGEALNISLVQANISLAEKWQPESRESLMQTYLAASRAIHKADLIVWPEASLPMILDEVPNSYLSDLRNLNASLVFGVVEREIANSRVNLYNSLVVVNAQNDSSQPLQTYKKRHLVPFGEFFPLKPLLGWIFSTFDIPMADFTSGGYMQGNVLVNGVKMLPTICYEDAYPEDWRRQIADAGVILNISEDAWFGDSLAPHQRLQMARMRAIEFQRPVIRASNSGLSTVIDARGQIDAISPQFEPDIFSSQVIPMQGETPYTSFGQWPLWLWMTLCVLFMLLRKYTSEG
jgi:apolipoprotein N-acyltransferase